jgi:hypothetical protein|nr:MAG TPA: Protein of unknown function (DUF1351) [Caudoviricetes sp.]
MKEMIVSVEQTEGIVNISNFEEIKANVQASMELYKSMTFTEDTLSEARSTVATLRKLSKHLDDKRKDVKKKCMMPYEEFENKINELQNIIAEPIELITRQTKEYEDKRIKQKKEEIQQIYDDCIEGMQEYIPLERIYDRTWENKGTLAKKIKEAIETYVDNAKMSVETIKNMHSEAEQRALEAFKKTLDLSVAVNLIAKYEADKAEILKREQERKAAEEERKRQEEKETEIKKTEVQRAVKSADDAFIEACNNAEDDISAAFDTEPFEQPHEYVLKIYCSESEKNKICEYINSLKVMYKEV